MSRKRGPCSTITVIRFIGVSRGSLEVTRKVDRLVIATKCFHDKVDLSKEVAQCAVSFADLPCSVKRENRETSNLLLTACRSNRILNDSKEGIE